ESIVQRLGGYHQSRQKAADLRGERRSYIAMATTILRDLGHDLDAAREADLLDVEALRPTTPARAQVDSLASERDAPTYECKDGGATIEALNDKLSRLRAERDALPPEKNIEPLRQSVRRAQRKGDLAEQRDEF